MDKVFESKLSTAPQKYWLTVFTATYNRAATLHRCYESLVAMRRPAGDGGRLELEWVIVDDGSEDNTAEIVKGWVDEDRLAIRYYRQPNSGKHIAMNNGVREARGEMFAVLDSDDTFLPNAMTAWYDAWHRLSPEQRRECKGVTARCADPATGRMLGTPLPSNPFIVNCQDLRYKYKVQGEMCGCIRVDLLRQYPFPQIDPKSRFCPESIVWIHMGERYKECVVEDIVREYYRDTTNAITRGGSTGRSRENYYLWQTMVNSCAVQYMRYSPKEMLKSVVGLSRDGFISRKSPQTILKGINGWRQKLLVAAFMPAGAILSVLRACLKRNVKFSAVYL